MSSMASQIIGVSIVCSTVCSGADHRKHQSSASLAFMRGIHRWPVDSPPNGSVMWEMLGQTPKCSRHRTKKTKNDTQNHTRTAHTPSPQFPFDDVIMLIRRQIRYKGSPSLNWFNFISKHGYVFTCPVMCRMKLLIHAGIKFKPY